MNEALIQALRTIRNDAAHEGRRSDVGALAKQLKGLGVSVPAADLQEFVADLLRGFGRDVGEYFAPTVLLDVVSLILDGSYAKVACDPWAGLGVLAARVHEKSTRAGPLPARRASALSPLHECSLRSWSGTQQAHLNFLTN